MPNLGLSVVNSMDLTEFVRNFNLLEDFQDCYIEKIPQIANFAKVLPKLSFMQICPLLTTPSLETLKAIAED